MDNKFLVDIYLKSGQSIRFVSKEEMFIDTIAAVFDTGEGRVSIHKEDISAITNKKIQ